jgi:hypothetical protein
VSHQRMFGPLGLSERLVLRDHRFAVSSGRG